MTLNSSGPMSIEGPVPPGQNIALELSLPTTSLLSMNDARLRQLAGVPVGPISLSDFYGKSSQYTIIYLIVAGGGGPGQGRGGAGGVVQGTQVISGSATFPVTVGGGGAGGSQYGINAPNGGDSGFNGLLSIGGGGGGNNGFTSSSYPPGSDGGSGGGGAPDNAQHNGGGGVPGQGYPGGFGQCWPGHGCWSGAGGGAGGSGQPGTGSSRNPFGGSGIVSNISGYGVQYAHGGGQGNPGTYGCGDGYDGVVIISYMNATPRATGGNITSYTDGGGNVWWVHTFTSSGTYTHN